VQLGTLYLLPTLLGESEIEQNLPAYYGNLISELDLLLVERPKTARAFIKKLQIEKPIADFQLEILDKRSTNEDILPFILQLINGKNIEVLSEAGASVVADPGSNLVQLAHENNIKIEPVIGPSSFLLALMASGLNGQNFAFTGYLPIKEPDRSKRIKQLEQRAQKEKQTQIFMETPYRNTALFQTLLKVCRSSTQLCVARNLTTKNQLIKTAIIKDWKNIKIDLHKQPCVFLLN